MDDEPHAAFCILHYINKNGEPICRRLQHGAYLNFCAGLLHRHLRLREGQAMIHVDDVCSAYSLEDIDQAQLTAHSFCLTAHAESGFRPYELALNHSLPRPTDEFLHDLHSFLQSRRLENVIALTPLPELEDDVLILETQLAEEAGSHSSTQLYAAAKDHAGTAVTTNWAFENSGDSYVNIREVKACVKNTAGVHEVKG